MAWEWAHCSSGTQPGRWQLHGRGVLDTPEKPAYHDLRREPPSSSGLGHRPLTAKTGVRVPLGVITQGLQGNLKPLSFLDLLRFSFPAIGTEKAQVPIRFR